MYGKTNTNGYTKKHLVILKAVSDKRLQRDKNELSHTESIYEHDYPSLFVPLRTSLLYLVAVQDRP